MGNKKTSKMNLEVSKNDTKFKKGQSPWNKGLKTPRESVEKMRLSKLGTKLTEEHKKKISQSLKGKRKKKFTKEHIKKLSQSHIGKTSINSARWKGGKTDSGHGYILVYKPDHPNAINNKYVREHRLVMEKHIGRLLKKTEVVHHIDGNTKNNKISNLMLFPSSVAHLKYHAMERKKLKEKNNGN